jgi:methanogenic corrinoid protein MtbC1
VIRWCCYCQLYMGESAPFDDPRFTHGICEGCDAKLERDEPLVQQTESERMLVNRLLAAARARDWPACEAVLSDARALGVRDDSLLVGLLQPALYQAGLDWQDGKMSIAAEQMLTSWIQRVVSSLPIAAGVPPLDVLFFQTPGNNHSLGPLFACHSLAARGFSVDARMGALAVEEMVSSAQRLRPRFIGLSCALPHAVVEAKALIDQLKAALEPDLQCRYVLSGVAFRLGGSADPPNVSHGAEVVLDLDHFAEIVTASRADPKG